MARLSVKVAGGPAPSGAHAGSLLTIDAVQMMVRPHPDGVTLTPGVSWVLSVDDLHYDVDHPGWMRCTILGSLVIMSEHWGVYVTARLVYLFPDGRVGGDSSVVSTRLMRDMIALAAPWSAQVLWQQATMSARTLIALCGPAHRDHLRIPDDMPATDLFMDTDTLKAAIESLRD